VSTQFARSPTCSPVLSITAHTVCPNDAHRQRQTLRSQV
jgi:hypothetical protein